MNLLLHPHLGMIRYLVGMQLGWCAKNDSVNFIERLRELEHAVGETVQAHGSQAVHGLKELVRFLAPSEMRSLPKLFARLGATLLPLVAVDRALLVETTSLVLAGISSRCGKWSEAPAATPADVAELAQALTTALTVLEGAGAGDAVPVSQLAETMRPYAEPHGEIDKQIVLLIPWLCARFAKTASWEAADQLFSTQRRVPFSDTTLRLRADNAADSVVLSLDTVLAAAIAPSLSDHAWQGDVISALLNWRDSDGERSRTLIDRCIREAVRSPAALRRWLNNLDLPKLALIQQHLSYEEIVDSLLHLCLAAMKESSTWRSAFGPTFLRSAIPLLQGLLPRREVASVPEMLIVLLEHNQDNADLIELICSAEGVKAFILSERRLLGAAWKAVSRCPRPTAVRLLHGVCFALDALLSRGAGELADETSDVVTRNLQSLSEELRAEPFIAMQVGGDDGHACAALLRVAATSAESSISKAALSLLQWLDRPHDPHAGNAGAGHRERGASAFPDHENLGGSGPRVFFSSLPVWEAGSVSLTAEDVKTTVATLDRLIKSAPVGMGPRALHEVQRITHF